MLDNNIWPRTSLHDSGPNAEPTHGYGNYWELIRDGRGYGNYWELIRDGRQAVLDRHEDAGLVMTPIVGVQHDQANIHFGPGPHFF